MSLNPFETGQSLSTAPLLLRLKKTQVLIPLRQGMVFRRTELRTGIQELSFNPFETGHGLSTF